MIGSDTPLSTKDVVFRELLEPERSDGYVSGRQLGERYHLSRTAVWKAVQALIRKGVVIESCKNRGYRLKGMEDRLDAEVIKSMLPVRSGVNVSVYTVIDSTNSEAKRRCASAGLLRDAAGTLTPSGRDLHRSAVIAAEQTAGRGRLGRTFYSPSLSGIYLSLIYIPEHGISRPACLTAAAAVGVCRALHRLYDVEPEIKWVNDVFIHGKKVCGILTEGVSNFETGIIEAAIVGIGINITDGAAGFPDVLAKTAGSVLGNTAHYIRDGIAVTRNMLAAAVIDEILKMYDTDDTAFFSEYRSRSMLIGKNVCVHPLASGLLEPGRQDGTFRAHVVDIDDEARLIVRDEQGKELALQSGEVTLSSATVADDLRKSAR